MKATEGAIRGEFLVEDPAWAEDFAPNGTLVQLGDLITRKRYAEYVLPVSFFFHRSC